MKTPRLSISDSWRRSGKGTVPFSLRENRDSPPGRRSGLTLLVVLLLISMTLGLTYAAMRSQSTALMIQRNFGRRTAARQLALTGLTTAIKKMHQSDWNGVDTELTGALSGLETFRVGYSTGDPSLVPGHPDYQQLPYRVTLLSTGFAADPDDPTRIATHQARAVMRLVPRAVSEEPAGWSKAAGYTLGQWRDGSFEINVPCRIEGPVRIQQRFDLANDYPGPLHPRVRYLTDLERMRQSGHPDWRPLTGAVDLPYDHQYAGSYGQVSVLGAMGVATNDVARQAVAGFAHPGEMIDYRIYPGGKVYSAEVLGQDHRNVTRRPDPVSNPLGIYFRREKARVFENVTFQGTLITSGGHGANVEVFGTNVQFLPQGLPPLHGSDQPVRLPVIIAAHDVRFQRGARATVTGMVAAMHKFEVNSGGQQETSLAVQGGVLARDVRIRGRSEWFHSTDWWAEKYDDFLEQLEDSDDQAVIAHFPLWLRIRCGLDPQPQLTIKPDPTPVRYHWHNRQDPVYVPHRDDEGLRWELVGWTDNP